MLGIGLGLTHYRRKGGGASLPAPTYHLNFDGVNDRIVVPAAASLNNLPLGDFTVEFSGTNLNLSQDYGELSVKFNADYKGWSIALYKDGSVIYINATITYDNWGAAISPYIAVNAFMSNTHHYEITWSVANKDFKFFIDGQQQTISSDGSYGTPDVYDGDNTNDLIVGYDVLGGGSPLEGALHWLRISNIARHTSNFTPPSLTGCPPADPNTVLRLDLDEGTGTTANDTSGNNNNGTISGATWEAD